MHLHLRPLRRAAALAVPLGSLLAILALSGGSPAATSAVSVFPVNGSRLANPRTQITFRGLPTQQFSSITVTASKTGAHTGTVKSDSDGHGGSFIPNKPFTPGDAVTVTTHMNIVGASNGVFHFTVSSPAGGIPFFPFRPSPRVRGDILHFRSRPDLVPAAVRVTKRPSHTAHGYIFVSPWSGPIQNGPMVLDSNGHLIWFKALPQYHIASDVRVQTYRGNPVLTWWQGTSGAGIGNGVDVINDNHYNQIATVQAGNGLRADLHDFELTRQGTALILAEYPVHWDASSIHQSKTATVFDTVVQEIDIPTGLVLFQWDSLDHIPLTQSYTPFTKNRPFDFFHGNAIELDRDGSVIVSARATSAVYKIDHSSGKVIWTLGGKASSFKLGPGAAPAFQHDAVVRGSNDGLLTAFDNGDGAYQAHKQSRALWLRVDVPHKTVTKISEIDHSPPLVSAHAGSVEVLYNGDAFVGWGQQLYFSEYNSRGKLNFDARFVDTNTSYRAYRMHWNGYPEAPSLPAVATSSSGGRTTVYVSWNGATEVSHWRVLAGASSTSLKTVTTAKRSAFETSIGIARTSYVQVQGLDGRGRVLGSSAVTHVG